MNLGQIGRSPAGKRIWASGLRYQASLAQPLPIARSRREPPEQEQFLPVPPKRAGATIPEIAEAVSVRTSVSVADMRGKKTDRITTDARQAAYYACVIGTNETHEAIGRWFNRDQTTVTTGAIAAAERYGLPYPSRKRGVKPIIKASDAKDQIQELWAAEYSANSIASYLGVTRQAVIGFVNRQRAKEGAEKWPKRKSGYWYRTIDGSGNR